MSIFKSILSKIMGSKPSETSTEPTSPREVATATLHQGDVATEAATTVDIADVLSGMASKSSEKLNWRESIVDLMKLVGIDSSLTARKTLATELGYTGDMSDSASMNIWLHKQVMTKLAQNGGVVPPELLQ